MGVFFYTNSVALIEDVPLDEDYRSEDELITAMEAGFQQVYLLSIGMNWQFYSIMRPFICCRTL